MKRLVLALIAALGLLGCKSAPPATDPFMRTTVPPPGTGAGDPYYPPGAAPPATAPPLPNGMPANTPPPGQYKPPGGNIYFQQSATDQPAGDKAAAEESTGDKPAPGSLAAALASGPNTFESMAANAKSGSETPEGAPPENEDDDLPAMKNSDRFQVAAKDFASDSPVKPAAIAKADKPPVDPFAAAKSAPAAKPKPTIVAAEEPASDETPQELPAESEVFRKDRSRMDSSEIRLASAALPVSTEEEFAPEPEGAVRNAVAVSDDVAGEDNGTEIRILSPDNDGQGSEASSLAISETPPLPSEAEPTRQETALVVRNPRNFTAAPPTEITDLPNNGFRPARKPINVVQASHSMAIASDSESSHKSTPIRPTIVGSPAAVARTGARYAHGPDYEWLHGRLEYLQGSKQWKIRYIPIDGQTDDYGGSVMLKSSPALEGFKAGDFVAIRGSLGQKSEARGFSPTYDLRLIEPLRQ